ncbi:hypothetical protein [Pedobacter cryoconitis]|uniref:MerC mercury resistance protein n=1 Tax=Pedobacter cryoconitis TaxID=188932 RepID=A0A7X0J508_9SPHI|nr:hypothetical protein [Pedobacter cryoconitis]MBB6499932.1 hypothetical protein [Pedobacter cryoconitis]
MSDKTETSSCNCNTEPIVINNTHKTINGVTKTVKAIPSAMMSILIAFFPKCPLCWAVYMSMFSSIGLAQIPYLPWLLPILIGFMGVHLLLLFKKIRTKGYLPFFISLCGCGLLLLNRFAFPAEKLISMTGLSLIIIGSLLNNLTTKHLSLTFSKNTNKP